MDAGLKRLQSWYTPSTGLYQTTNWWNAANAITVLADASLATDSHRYDTVFANTFTQAQNKYKGFLNDYYDDEGWWALAWIAAYDRTHRPEYLETAASIFRDMSGAWDQTCDGGIWWSRKRHYKNAIANELFLDVAAHLANRAAAPQRDEYRAWAQKEWSWFRQTGMINGQHLINDGLTAACKNNDQTTWTYNQGVILGGLAELNRAAPSPELLPTAASIADAALTHLTDHQGILHDPCESKCGGDGVQFKGIFVRNLMLLDFAQPDSRYVTFAVANAESIWKNARGRGNDFGVAWSGPFAEPGAGTQTSALDAFVAAYAGLAGKRY